jgi:hypothetical protein
MMPAAPEVYQQYPPASHTSLEQNQGTIMPAANFNPEMDCRALSQAMKGTGRTVVDRYGRVQFTICYLRYE